MFPYDTSAVTLSVTQNTALDLMLMFPLPGDKDSSMAFSQSYAFHLEVAAVIAVDPSMWLNHSAYLTISTGDVPYYIHGVITDIRRVSQGKTQKLIIILHSPLYSLASDFCSRVYCQKTIIDITSDILEQNGILKNHIHFQLQNTYTLMPLCVQYEESSEEFLKRWFSHFGLYYFFKQEKDFSLLIITDTANAHSSFATPLPFHEEEGLIISHYWINNLRETQILINDSMVLFHEDYENITTKNNTLMKGFGEIFEVTQDYSHNEEGQQLAHVRQVALDCQRRRYSAISNCPALYPGVVIEITGHPYESFNQRYTVIQVTPYIEQVPDNAKEGKGILHKCRYTNTLILIPESMEYKSAYISHPLHSYLKAIICGDKETPAIMDNQGRYNIRFCFQSSEEQNHYPVYLAQMNRGNNFGMHFPLKGETEVLLGFINGDINRPFIQGVLPSIEQIGPVTGDNSNDNILRTAGEAELNFSDEEHSSGIWISTAQKKQCVELWDLESGEMNFLLREGEGVLEADEGMTWQTHEDCLQEFKGSCSISLGGKAHMEASTGSMYIHSQDNLHLRAQEDMQQIIREGALNCISKQNMHFTLEKDVSFCSEKSDIAFSTQEGDLAIQTQGDMLLSVTEENDLSLKLKDSSFTITAAGDIILSAKNIYLSGDAVVFSGETSS